MLTYFRTQYGKYPRNCADTYELNEHFVDDIDDEHILVTTRHRAWAVLEHGEYELLTEGRLEESLDLYSTLEDLGIILTDRNINDVARLYAERYQYLSRPPALFIMIPTKRCNQGCGYCHSNSQYVRPEDSGWDMKEEIAFKTVDFFLSIPRADSSNFHLEFQGGEALLCYDYVQKIMDYAIKQAAAQGATASFYIASNLTLMTDEIAEDVKQRGNVRMGSSVDGPKDIHDTQRPMKGGGSAYEKVVYWVKRLREKFGMDIGVLSTVSRRHLNREKEVIDTQISLGTNHLTASRFLHYGEKRYRNKMLTAEEAFESWKRSLEYILEKNKQGQYSFLKLSTRFTLTQSQTWGPVHAQDQHKMLLAQRITKARFLVPLMSPFSIPLGPLRHLYTNLLIRNYGHSVSILSTLIDWCLIHRPSTTRVLCEKINVR